ncbi:MAG: tol-pal system protein YbgF [Pseudomonadota bacterium]
MRRLAVTALVAVGMSGCALTPPSEDPVLIKLNNMERRLEALERILANGSLVELTLQLDEVDRRTAELQGRTEELEHTAEGDAERQRVLYADLDDRIQALEGSLQQAAAQAPNVLDGGTLGPGELPVPGGSDRDNYQAAFELLKEQRYDEAAIAFDQILGTFPDSTLADNAQYWLAESHYVTNSFPEALAQFQVVIDRYPRSRKVPDALLKMGYCNYELERWDDAKAALTQVQNDFPDTTAARLAGQRLKRIADEGN